LFDFQNDTINEKKFGSNKEIDPILVPNDNPDLVFLIDTPIAGKHLSEFKNYMKGNFPNVSYTLVSVLSFDPSKEDLKRDLTNLYLYESINLEKFIKPWSKVITIGRALYSITGDDLSIEGFYDTILWDTSFFDPKTKSRIFPVPFLSSWIGKDCFEDFFTKKQIQLAHDFTVQKIRIQKPRLELVENSFEFFTKWLSYDGITAFDLETKSLDPWSETGRIICLTVAFECEVKELKAYYIPFKNIDTELLNRFFSNKKLIGNNLKYDVRWLRVKAGVQRENIQIFWDNMKGSHAINEMQYNSLKSDAWLFTTFGGYDIDLEKYKIKYPKCKEDYSLIPFSVMFPYATMDALVSLLCYIEQQKKIDELDVKCHITNGWSIRKAIEDVYIPALNMFSDIEIAGMNYDWDKLEKTSIEFKQKLDAKKKEVEIALGVPPGVDIDSGMQFGKFLKSKGWENPGLSKGGYYLTNEASMTYWKKKGHKEVDLINEYTSMKSLFKTYIGSKEDNSGYFQYRKSDNKLHGSFAVMMADSWRGKSYDPNLQNIPSHGDLAAIVRANFSVPSTDYYISENDASGLQLRIGATMSQDQKMIEIFTKLSGDMHSVTAQGVLRQDLTLEEFLARKKEPEIKETRFTAKAINFGLEFGMGAYTFANQLKVEWSLEKAKDYVHKNGLKVRQEKIYKNELAKIDEAQDKDVAIQDALEFSFFLASSEDIRRKFFEVYFGLEQWHSTQHEFAREHGYIQSLWGPIRRTPFLIYEGSDDDKGRIKNYENIVLNSPVQNWEVMYMMYNMSRLHKEIKEKGLKSYIVGNVHDSCISYIHKDEKEIMKELFIKYFHQDIPEVMLGIPYILEGSLSDYYAGEYWHVTEQPWF